MKRMFQRHTFPRNVGNINPDSIIISYIT